VKGNVERRPKYIINKQNTKIGVYTVQAPEYLEKRATRKRVEHGTVTMQVNHT